MITKIPFGVLGLLLGFVISIIGNGGFGPEAFSDGLFYGAGLGVVGALIDFVIRKTKKVS